MENNKNKTENDIILPIKVQLLLKDEMYSEESKSWRFTIRGEIRESEHQAVEFNCLTLPDAIDSFKEDEVYCFLIQRGSLLKMY